jgi:UDP-2,3-diacylglucosamine hydrolase
MHEAGATCLCLTAGKTLIFDRDEMLAYAERRRISVVAAPPA